MVSVKICISFNYMKNKAVCSRNSRLRETIIEIRTFECNLYYLGFYVHVRCN